MYIKFQISDPIWWGYNLTHNILEFNNLDEIVEYTINNLITTLKSLNLLPQAELLKNVKKDFHIHGNTFEDILNLNEDEIVYICRHENIEKDTIKI
jgi:hypothetical protein